MNTQTKKVLVSAHDHGYREAYVTRMKVVYNTKYQEWYEYHGDEYLSEGDTVLEMDVVD
jgi:hypothetical protein